jgi:hypothetical protein
MARTPNGASSICLGKDGYWHRRVTVGVKDDGRLDRRHVMGTQADVTRKVRALERQRDASPSTVTRPCRRSRWVAGCGWARSTAR